MDGDNHAEFAGERARAVKFPVVDAEGSLVRQEYFERGHPLPDNLA